MVHLPVVYGKWENVGSLWHFLVDNRKGGRMFFLRDGCTHDELLQMAREDLKPLSFSALSLWHSNLKLLLVTLGDKGCRYYTKDEARLREVLRFANACGAITTTKKGAIPALPTESEVQSLLKGN